MTTSVISLGNFDVTLPPELIGFLEEYFVEISCVFLLALVIFRLFSLVAHHLRTPKPKTLPSEQVKNIVCYNQGKIAEVQYTAGKRHKQLRLALAAYNQGEEGASKEKLEAGVKRVQDHLSREIIKAAYRNFELLHPYFAKRHPIAPRICLKTNYTSQNVEQIVPLARCAKSGRKPLVSSKIEGNTGFSYIRATGQYYLLNDIPTKANDRDDPYLNPRLDLGKVRLYHDGSRVRRWVLNFYNGFLSHHLRRFSNRFPSYIEDRKWRECWQRSDGEVRSDFDCYKSTLIIPLTYWNSHELSDEFFTGLDLFDPHEYENTNVKARAILGYLCIDHIEKNFFNKPEDIAMGYVVADMLCLYLTILSNYTRTSQTMRDTLSELENSTQVA